VALGQSPVVHAGIHCEGLQASCAKERMHGDTRGAIGRSTDASPSARASVARRALDRPGFPVGQTASRPSGEHGRKPAHRRSACLSAIADPLHTPDRIELTIGENRGPGNPSPQNGKGSGGGELAARCDLAWLDTGFPALQSRNPG